MTREAIKECRLIARLAAELGAAVERLAEAIAEDAPPPDQKRPATPKRIN
ncbi:MAG: hypothetical protein LAQ30_31115 [Acidobacteriia bacterium]|nr:hypothetical protein [Terriglobia bacterium]